MKVKHLINLSLITASILFNGCKDGSSSNIKDGTTPELLVENEPYYKYSWHLNSKDSILNNEEFYDEKEGRYRNYIISNNADINITEVWNITKGSNIKVAVIDDSFDVEHEDLKDNIFITYNADENTSDVSNKTNEASHGNTCAGFIMAPINGKGIVGIAPQSKLIAIKQEDDSTANTIKAFEFAKNQGAKVISCSWGTENIDEALETELKSIYDAGITVLFASGNDAKSLDDAYINDESESQWVIGVGASDEANDIAEYSNWGSEIDILAPGGGSPGILGIDDSGTKGSEEQKNLVSNSYAFTQGTSFATPVAAGVVALMYSLKPDITPAQVRTILINSADKIGDNNASYIDGFDEKRAYGKINVGKIIIEVKKLTN